MIRPITSRSLACRIANLSSNMSRSPPTARKSVTKLALATPMLAGWVLPVISCSVVHCLSWAAES